MNQPASSDWTTPAGLLALMSLEGVGPARAIAIARGEKPPPEADPAVLSASSASAQGIIEAWEAAGVAVVGYFDPTFPERVRGISSPPAVLFCRGSLPEPERPALAVIGTRQPTAAGEDATRTLTAAAVKAGLVIVSGLALGIDGLAHQAALDRGGTTVAVLGNGLDTVSPARHRPLAEQILSDGGALLSEQAPGVKPSGPTLVARNRLQVGLADALLLIESGLKGGSMHTARFAAEQGRPIYCPDLGGEDEARAGINALLERPARELPALLPAWAKAQSLAERIGDRPLAQPVPRDLDQWLASISAAAAGPLERPGEQLSLGP